MKKYSVFHHHVSCAAQELGCGLESALDMARDCGIGYIELDRDAIGATDEEILALGEQLARHGLKPSSIYGHYSWDHDPTLPGEDDLLIHQAKLLGCERIMIIPGFYSDLSSAEKCEQEKQQMIAGTRRLAELAAAQGLTATIECYDNARSPIATIRGMKDFVDACPELYVTLETGNYLFSGDDILEAKDIFRDRVRHVHLTARTLPAEGEATPAGDPTTAVTGLVMYPCAVGHGHIPMDAVLDELHAWGYDGVMTIEHFGAASYAQAIRDSMAWLKEKEKQHV